MIAIGVVAIAGVGNVSAAPAAGRVAFDVSPAVPNLGSTLTVTGTAPRLKAGTSYQLGIDRKRYPDRLCKISAGGVTVRRLAGGRFSATVRPGPQEGADSPPAKVWCPGPAIVTLYRHGPGKLQTALAKRAIRFTRGGRETDPPPIPAHEVSITFLPGSTLTAWAPGRPERSTPVTGSLLGRFRNGEPDPRNPATTQIAGTLSLPSLAADPLCPGSTPPTSVEVDSSSTMASPGPAGSTLSLVLRAQPEQLFGCGAPGGLTGTTTLTSVGSAVTLNRMPMIGVVGDVALPGGSQGGITTNLLVNWDFTKQWRP